MKTIHFLFALLALIVVVMAAVAYAEPVNGTHYTTTVYSAAGTASTAVYSDAFRVTPGTKKTIAFFGYSSTTSTIPTTGAMSGTAALQCDSSGTGSGPFVPARDIGGVAVTGTANTSWDLDNLCNWLRVVWTKTGSANQKLFSTIQYHD